LICFFALSFAAACAVQQLGQSGIVDPTLDGLPPEFERLLEVWELLEGEHINGGKLDPQEVSDGAIRGMLDALGDPYSAFYNAEQYKITTQDLKGFFEGIGAEVGIRNGLVTILAPMPDTPAERAGILPGDIILEIEDESAEGISLMEAVNRIRGKKGTVVKLLILHRNDTDPVVINVERGVITLISVRINMGDNGIGHLRIFNFAETTNKDLLNALKRFEDSGGTGIVLDLRNNPGGLLTSVVDVTSQFLEDGLVLYQIDAQGHRTDWKVKSGGKAKEIPFVVLVNEFSASASEVFTGAMMDHERATVLGGTTFGKGSVSNLWVLQDGSGVNFTIAHWFTPNGTLIEGEGLSPDVQLDKVEDGSEDVHLNRAIEFLRKQIAQGS
jgi:carboxyl-terminal processing protease